ncbi:hypothetical protein J6TS1_41460 [Siminovitchia terrae]|uniref:Uncharacterized protein n=1 Tax=Siminovitchia terrae TaxID=1914933 RepID=A0ABQ4L328_SIMTE|nr:hypothetical protein J22TS1_31490 [Siminovitchia terrae]GIN98276.1 hypothetical protein J6TS1_41460 [Siminovitchia terrae]
MPIGILFSGGSTPGRIKLKPPADVTDFQREFIELKLDKIWVQIRQGSFDDDCHSS